MLLGAFQPPSRRAKNLNLIRTINPEFKDLAQTWGWKMITVCIATDPVVGLRWSKSSEQHG
jgi:hypothetical protein